MYKVCDICKSRVVSDKFEEHKMNHDKFKCTFCEKQCKDIWSYKIHHGMHIKKQKFPCADCDESFEHMVNLARHISIVHKKLDPSKIECPFCKKMVSAINAHLRTHQDNPRDCEICKATLKNYSAYKSHMRFHEILSKKGVTRSILPRNAVRVTKVVKCGLCSKSCRNSCYLNSHLKSCVQVPLFPCRYCDTYRCSCQEELIKHVSEVHRSIPVPYSQCPYCAQTVDDIESHIKLHRMAIFECEKCIGLTFEDEASLRKHIKRKHKSRVNDVSSVERLSDKYHGTKGNMTLVRCLLCEARMPVAHMVRHMTLCHRSYRCILCHKTLHSLPSLAAHKHRHNNIFGGNGVSKCPACPRAFVSHIRLVAHVLASHRMLRSISRRCGRC